MDTRWVLDAFLGDTCRVSALGTRRWSGTAQEGPSYPCLLSEFSTGRRGEQNMAFQFELEHSQFSQCPPPGRACHTTCPFPAVTNTLPSPGGMQDAQGGAVFPPGGL